MAQSIYTRGKNEEGKWRYSRVEAGRGHKTSHLEPPFFVRPFRNGKQVWHLLGAQTFKDAEVEAEQVGVALEAQARGLTVAELADDPNRISLANAIDKFIKNAEATKKRKTVIGYRLNLNQFAELSPSIRFLDQVTGDAIRAFRDSLHDQGYDTRTQHNRIITVLSLLKRNNLKTDFSMKGDLLSFEEGIPVPYSNDQLEKLFKTMVEKETVNEKTYSGKWFGEKIRFQFFLGTGCRDKEVTYAAWDDIDFDKKTYHVRGKKGTAFTPKNWSSGSFRCRLNWSNS